MEGEITKLTMREAEAEMAEFRKIFTVVRLLKKKEIAGICGKDNLPEKSCPCYSFWAKDEPCENCVSAKACIETRDIAKLEFSDKNVYHVISRYVEVDGEPCVMECLRVFDEESLMDYSGGDRLLSHMNGYYEKMYTAEEISSNGDGDVFRALRELDEKYRSVMVLFYVEGYDVKEISAMLRVPQGTVKSRLSRGREKLKTIIENA